MMMSFRVGTACQVLQDDRAWSGHIFLAIASGGAWNVALQFSGQSYSSAIAEDSLAIQSGIGDCPTLPILSVSQNDQGANI